MNSLKLKILVIRSIRFKGNKKRKRKSEDRKKKKKQSGLSIKENFVNTEKNLLDNMQNRKRNATTKTL